MRQHVNNELNNLKVGHSKVSCIVDSDLKSPQICLTSSILSNENKSLLFKGSRTIADLIYGEKDMISPSTLIFAPTKG